MMMKKFDIVIIERYSVDAADAENAVNKVSSHGDLISSTIQAFPAGTVAVNIQQLINSYIIIYIKIYENKKSGMIFQGPFYGPIEETEKKAKLRTQRLINDSKGCSIITKIFKITNEHDQYEIMNDVAKPIFDKLKRDMIESKEIFDRKKRKRHKFKSCG